jgi:NADPH:quinone reductase-like Zn-dependent oxidoreductase
MPFRYEMQAAGADNVRRVEVEDAAPQAGQLKVRVRASSINFHDFATLLGLVPGVKYPTVPLSDGCGEIVAIGAGVTGFAIGEHVLPAFYPHWKRGKPSRQAKRDILGETMDGCLQEFLLIDASAVAKAPAHLSDMEAATLPCAGLTAWYALMEDNQLTDEHIVLVQGTGGLSLAALQIAKAVGAKVAITSSSDEKLQRAKTLGADYLINYKTHADWESKVLELTGGVDIVVDAGGQETLGRAVRCTRHNGFIAVIGVLSGFDKAPMSVVEIMYKNLTVKGVTVGSVESLQRYCGFVERHAIKPVISHVLPACNLAQGVDVLMKGAHFGKVAITVE